MKRDTLQFAWHVHHDTLMELLTRPLAKRVAYISRYKPRGERKTRLRLLKLVTGRLPKAVVEAGQPYKEAARVYYKTEPPSDKAWEALEKARRLYDKALHANRSAIEALHAIECSDCPWDGRTIFPCGSRSIS